ncbi:unnamed protein product [Cuscuta epithymum]|uniref:Uncharacterized protein n=1 Tax=Cuscuta epithymum TaxID=186058 RepID=A0AAV0CRU4_9ASTE|nr:unnamed protein product [Cuscuta epithymum]
MDDIYQMPMVYGNKSITKNKVLKEGYEAIRRFMLRQVRVHVTHDLQMALENNIRKANLTKPLLYGLELEDYPPYFIFDDPVTVIYLNHERLWISHRCNRSGEFSLFMIGKAFPTLLFCRFNYSTSTGTTTLAPGKRKSSAGSPFQCLVKPMIQTILTR